MNQSTDRDGRVLDWRVIKDRVNNLIEFYINMVDRNFPMADIPEARVIFLSLAHVMKNTYRSIFFLCDMVSKDPARKVEYALSSIPLLRFMLEEIFALCFISEDVQTRIAWYRKAGWREMKEEYDRCRTEYGDDSEWQEWFTQYEHILGETESHWGLSQDEVDNFSNRIPYWPIPGRMISTHVRSEDLKKFLQYLQDWFYKQFSQVAHLSWPGLSIMGSYFLQRVADEEGQERLMHSRRSDCAFHTVTLVLAFFSELENILHFNHKDDLKYVWTVIIEYWNVAKELYDIRYRALLE